MPTPRQPRADRVDGPYQHRQAVTNGRGAPRIITYDHPGNDTIDIAESLDKTGRLDAAIKVLQTTRSEVAFRAGASAATLYNYRDRDAWPRNECSLALAESVIEVVRLADERVAKRESLGLPTRADLTPQVGS